MKAGTSRLKRAGYAVLATCAGLVAAGLLCEAAVRVFAPQLPIAEWFQESDTYQYVLKENFHQRFRFVPTDFVMDVRTNAQGLRDEPIDLSVPFVGKTVLLAGDSFTFGYALNVGDRFDSKLDAMFAARQEPVRCVNTGVPGWGTVQETAYARDHWALYRPDVIVLTFCGNDPHDDALFVNREMVFREKGLFRFPGKRFLRAHSHLYRYVLAETTVWRHNLWLKEKTKAPEPVHVDVQSACALSEEDWETSLACLRGFHEDFVSFNPSGVLLVQAASPLDDSIREHLSTLTNGVNLFYVDLSSRAAAMAPEERCQPFDGHWSPRMHEASAMCLYEALERIFAPESASPGNEDVPQGGRKE